MSESAGSWDSQSAARRIAQLEAALMRRSELLEQKHAALASIQASGAWKFVQLYYKLRDRFLPMHSRRREWLKRSLKLAFGAVSWLRGAVRRDAGADGIGLGVAPSPDVYRRWIRRYEPGSAELARQRKHVWPRSPKISLVVPVYNTPAGYLEAMVRSVVCQTYAHWELILADGASPSPHVRPLLERLAATDQRIRVRYLASNQGIVGNTNAAIEWAEGDYVAFVDHDDTLAPFALHEVVAVINRQPEADLIYSDEDKLDAQGQRVEPNFKPDWSPETLRTRNYVCHLMTLKRDLLTQLGGLRAGFDGAQDYDLVLRASEKARAIVHIPKILYHWRMHEQSTAANKSSKSYAFQAGKKALVEHFARLNIAVSVDDGPILGTYVPIYHLPTQPKVSVIIPNRDQAESLGRCVQSLAESNYANWELLIVENGSTRPETFAYYKHIEQRFGAKILTWDKPFNYAAVNNFAASHASGELLLFLNNDVEAIHPDWLEVLVKQAVQPGIGAVGAKLYYPDDTVQHGGIILGMGGIAGHAHLNFPREAPGYMQRLWLTHNCAAVTGACLLMPRAVFDELGGFDEGFVLAFNDVDLCVRVLNAGKRIVFAPQAELYHSESKTRGPEDTDEKQKRFRREFDLFKAKWQSLLEAGDPYYSPHFRLDRADYALKT